MFYSDCAGCSVGDECGKQLIISWLVNCAFIVESIERYLFAAFWRFLLKKSKKSAEKFAGKEKVRIFAARLRNNGKFFEIFLLSARKASEEWGSYLEVMTDRRFAVWRSNRQKDEEEKFFDKFEKR